MALVTTYDPRCHELAATFLEDEQGMNTEVHKHLLALEIQQVIEDEISFMRDHPDMYPELRSPTRGVYGEMCRDPKICVGKGYCPRDPACND